MAGDADVLRPRRLTATDVVKVTFEPDGMVAVAEPGRTMLYTALANGQVAPYECASGGCGSCRARIMDGDIRSLWPEAPGLTERDRRKGDRILLCQSVPIGDCVVQLARGGDSSGPPPRRLAATVVSAVKLNPSTMSLAVDTGDPLPYLPGQFVLLEFGDGTRRAYSMSRPSDVAGVVLEFIVRAKPLGHASAILFASTRPGQTLTVEGPYGAAHLRCSPRSVVCIAGGSGIGPMLAIADHATANGAVPSVDLYYGARCDDDLVVEDRLDSLAAHASARVHRIVERTTRTDTRTGLVTDAVIADVCAPDRPALADCDVYLAGPPAMVDAALAGLVRSGLARADHVYFDRFT